MSIFVFIFVKYFLHVHWFYVLESSNRQQTNDEENPETHQLLSHIDKENDRDGNYLFERNVQYTYYSLKLESMQCFFIFAREVLICYI